MELDLKKGGLYIAEVKSLSDNTPYPKGEVDKVFIQPMVDIKYSDKEGAVLKQDDRVMIYNMNTKDDTKYLVVDNIAAIQEYFEIVDISVFVGK